MVGKKHISGLSKSLGLILLFTIIISLVGCSTGDNSTTQVSNSKSKFSIGISQIIEHPALDSAREGFIAVLKEKGYEDKVDIDTQLAQGDISLTTTIANNFVSKKKDLILAISTPSAQSAFKATKNIPILFTSITDPVTAGILKDPNSPEGNITGTTDLAPLEKQIELGLKIVPKAKKVGVLYNTSEINSQIQVDKLKGITKDLKLELVEIPVTNTSEIEMALGGKIKGIDFLFLPSDNLVASSMPIVSKVCLQNKVVTIGVDEPMVKNGALACEGIDYFKLGYETGLMAIEILEGKEIKDIPVTSLEETQLTINEDIAEKLGISIPKELLDKAILVKGEN
ncbi:ABC transporter substrate-binding protein [Tissierella sp. MSJ-40]|uniref:ABC transporter substrate-binding protein n=1 Tax=Tissierella simiarum TaxID=2841534 RepID=A0ABS6E511_9FIRM|nr:ABC transporter substrate-binding protein [Tissierella simiarum]MBU5438005.1 ABC transporter substrate-binding protein [Tissierella simiarum]